MATIRLHNISKAYADKTILHDLSLTVQDGECFTLLGPSGCGKTVLLRLLAGFEKPDTGTIHIGEALVADAHGGSVVPPNERGLGVVFQDYAVWPHKSVFDNIAYPLTLMKVKGAALRTRVMEIVDMVNLTGLEQRMPSQLSGGQQQRVALGRALVARPALLLLDEPLCNLDANLREEMRFEIKQLQRTLGITILYVTHDQEVALAISDRIAIMDTQGNIRQIGSPEDIFEHPADSFIFRFMGVTNMLPATVRDGYYELEDGQTIPHSLSASAPPEQAVGSSGFLGFRPSDLGILSAGQGLRVKVLRNSFLGALTELRVELAGQEIRTQTDTLKLLREGHSLHEGADCGLEFFDVQWFPEMNPAEGV
ncbi:MAG: ABC transporter ATP-binding protein [Desulfovibrionaceae bacterium]